MIKIFLCLTKIMATTALLFEINILSYFKEIKTKFLFDFSKLDLIF